MRPNGKATYMNRSPKPFSAEDYIDPETYQQTRVSVESALTMIPEAYTCETFYAIEQERVFGNSWVPVALTSQVRDPGDVCVIEVTGQSIIITRNKAGELRAFYNVCRHRGTLMLDAECTELRGGRIHCPYHRWAYDLDGNCIGTPLFEGSDIPDEQRQIFDMTASSQGGVKKFDRADYPLFPVHIDTWGFLIFVNLAASTSKSRDELQPLADQLGDLPQRFANYRLHEWVVTREKEFIFKANYKLVGENFIEYYHLP